MPTDASPLGIPDHERATRRVAVRLQRVSPDRGGVRAVPPILRGRYELRHRLGTDAASELFLATDLALEREVAVRVLRPHLAADPRELERFKRESQALAQVDTPNAITVHDLHVGEPGDDDHFVVLRHVPGRTLAQLIADHRALPVDRALRITGELLGVLAELRGRRVARCGLRPTDILIDWHDRLVLLDVRPSADAARDDIPELARVGLLLLTMLTGAEPATPTDGALTVLLARVPPPLARVIRRAVARDPIAAFESIEAMSAALEHARRELTTTRPSSPGLPVAAPAVPPTVDLAPLRWLPWLLALQAVLLGAVFLSAAW